MSEGSNQGVLRAAAAEDTLFRKKLTQIEDFVFDQQVAAVFDDMVLRSVPFYAEMQRMVVELTLDHAQSGSAIYDLGCSTGTTLARVGAELPADIRLIGIDNSADMLERCRARLAVALPQRPELELLCADLNQLPPLEHASVALMILTLQFVRPLQRERLLRNIHESLAPGGALILVEKVLAEPPALNRRYIEYYHAFKRRQGYSDLEISQKREALENVLVPFSLGENRELLAQAGFADSELFFRWYNFSGLIAIKAA